MKVRLLAYTKHGVPGSVVNVPDVEAKKLIDARGAVEDADAKLTKKPQEPAAPGTSES